ncbi:MAG: 2-oxo acid dehydrogenase subunit E2 [Spirochaetales bacterium]|nr:2-oxo acid dehydrogenase subunit E2 [Spirochaetales bacterium]
MLFKKRPDGTLIKGLHHFTRALPYMMPGRTESAIYFEQDFDITETLAYIDRNRGKTRFFQIFLCALARTIALRPDLNRFVSGYNYYQRNQILLNFIAKKELTDEGEEINVSVPFSPFDTLHTVKDRMERLIEKGRKSEDSDSDDLNVLLMKFPRVFLRFFFWMYRFLDFHNILPASLIKSDPTYVSTFITNVGSVGIDAPFHHNFEHGNCGIFIALGKYRKFRYIDEEGRLVTRDVVKVTFTYDDRIKDGIYCARSIDLLKKMVENPALLETPPALEDVDLKRLNLKHFPAEKAQELRAACLSPDGAEGVSP